MKALCGAPSSDRQPIPRKQNTRVATKKTPTTSKLSVKTMNENKDAHLKEGPLNEQSKQNHKHDDYKYLGAYGAKGLALPEYDPSSGLFSFVL